MSTPSIEGLGFTPYVAPTISTPAPTSTASTEATGQAFGDLVLDGLDRLEAVQDKADNLSVRAATGSLENIHDYTLAATEAAVTTQLTTAVRNRALEAFNEIMRMPIG